jgi:transposase InsO family protein
LSPESKSHLLASVQQALRWTDQPARQVLQALGLAPASYYRWLQPPAPPSGKPPACKPSSPAPTPQEERAVRAYALLHPRLGYKRLTWQMLDADRAALLPYQVYQILGQSDLIARRPKGSDTTLRRPQPPQRPDEVWHLDLMYVFLGGKWYYLVDIVDGYSRFLVHWSLNTTMLADTVTLTVQEALDRLDPRLPELPRLVHDHGSQFVSAEWRSLMAASGLVDIKTRVAHPQSNGIVERLHRTHREEASLDADAGFHAALERFSGWSRYYNYERPHSALRYLCPFDYYRGDPEARLAERRRKLAAARQARAAYWSHANT